MVIYDSKKAVNATSTRPNSSSSTRHSSKQKYDFVFDKSADVVMLYSAERFDISDLVIRTITRASKRKQATNRKDVKKQKKKKL